MLSETLAATVALGFLGSLHCAFMCGPLLVAACGSPAGETGGRWRGALAYFAARAVGYAFAGAVIGHLGGHLAHCFSATGVPLALVLLVALAALVKGVRLLRASRRRTELVALRSPGLSSRIARLVASVIPRRAAPLGLVTAVLPCGMLAAAWALAASTSHPASGALVMLVFAVVTAPGLVASLLLALPLSRLRGRWSPAWQGAAWCALSIWIALRPLLDAAAHAGHGGHH